MKIIRTKNIKAFIKWEVITLTFSKIIHIASQLLIPLILENYKIIQMKIVNNISKINTIVFQD